MPCRRLKRFRSDPVLKHSLVRPPDPHPSIIPYCQVRETDFGSDRVPPNHMRYCFGRVALVDFLLPTAP